jgi:hypothetical protein
MPMEKTFGIGSRVRWGESGRFAASPHIFTHLELKFQDFFFNFTNGVFGYPTHFSKF